MPGGISIVVPGEPAAKGRPRIGRMKNGRPVAITPTKTRTREGVIASLAIEAMAGRPPLDGPVALSVTAIFAIGKSWSKKTVAAALAGFTRPTKRPDGDNLLKLAADSLNSIVYVDDAQVVEATVSKAWGRVPQTIITVKPVVAA